MSLESLELLVMMVEKLLMMLSRRERRIGQGHESG